MDDNCAIRLTNVTKRFKLYRNPVTGPIKESLFFWKKTKYYEEFSAVKNVSFEVKKGEVVGILGPNGAGKTTLLKMIAGLLPVNEGMIETNGRVSALLALGVGIHPEFTGRENILYQGMLLGMSKKEVLSKMDDIVEFAELNEYIDHPFRTYSSGMMARLLFSVSMSLNPEILIVDEALATGDAYFLQKSTRRIEALCKTGATILFVTHSLAQIKQLCTRAIYVSEGQVVKDGEPSDVVSEYNHVIFEKEKAAAPQLGSRKLESISGTGEVQITDVRLRNESGSETTGFYSGEPMYVEICYKSSFPRRDVDLFAGFIRCLDNAYIGETNTPYYVEPGETSFTSRSIPIGSEGVIRLQFEPLLLLTGHYALWIIIYEGEKYYCEYKLISPFFVSRKGNAWMKDAVFWQPCKIVSYS
jgi:ABC-type polysaccharide/polyol phosphate transport system ATPase subunit